MRKALCGGILVAAVIVSLVSCNTSIAEKYGLPEDPVATVSTEMVDSSRIFTDQYLAVMYTGFTLSDSEWANHLSVSASVEPTNGGTLVFSDLKVYQLEDGTVFCVDTMTNDHILQLPYTITLTAIDGSDEETLTKDFVVGTGDGSSLSLRELAPAGSTSKAPWVCPNTPAFDIAISDDKASIFIRPQDDFGAACNFSAIIYETTFAKIAQANLSSDARYLLSIPHSALETGKWTRLVVSANLERTTSSDPLSTDTVDAIRGGCSFKYWATTQPETKDWGTAITTYAFGAGFAATEPDAADVIELSADMAAARSLGTVIYSPTLKRQLGLGD